MSKMVIAEGVELDVADFRQQAGLEERSAPIHHFPEVAVQQRALGEGYAAAESFGRQAQQAVEKMYVEIKAGDDHAARQAAILAMKKLGFVLKGLGQKSMAQQVFNMLKTMPKV